MISYSTNWMGPINMRWYKDRGLTEKKSQVLTEDSFLVKSGKYSAGDVWEYEDITTYYSAGRIDIYGVPDEPYPLEYGLAPMHGEDWNDFSDWLEEIHSEELWEFDDLIAQYEKDSDTKIRWSDDTWYRCWECGLITDLRKHTKHIHKMDCSKNWSKE